MSSRNLSVHKDDLAIPEPSYFARQMRWARQGQEAWTWQQLVDRAAQTYWANRRNGRDTEDVAA